MDALRTAVLVALALFAAGYALWVARWFPVSYTHLTLPTIA